MFGIHETTRNMQKGYEDPQNYDIVNNFFWCRFVA